MKDDFEDVHLFNSFRAGNDEAFAKLYQHYAPRLIEYAARRLESLDEARDLIQDLFVYLWDKRDEIEIKQSVKGYLFLALNRRILNHYRKNSYRNQYADHLQRMEAEYFFGPDTFVEAKEVQQIVLETLPNMPKRVREIYLLSRQDQLSNAEIAQLLDISERTVKNQLSTALSILRKSLKRVALSFPISLVSMLFKTGC